MDIKGLQAVALSVRTLSMDAIQKANSGHPGLPLGCAELGALLYGEILKHYPKVPTWPNRDRFILSAGHGSMFLYSLLHLAGYDLTLEDLKNFRQLHSRTPGHPEYGHTPGVETTTGPLGQGIANAVGMAIAERMLAAKFNTTAHRIIDHYTFALAGDGCMMEGIASEAASLAGHLGLGKLIVFYDSNRISIEGPTDITFTEDVGKRFEAYGWQVLQGDMYDIPAIANIVSKAKAESQKPTLIILKSIIGKGAPNKQGSHEVHGAPLGADEVRAAKRAMGVPEDAEFYIHPDALTYFKERAVQFEKAYKEWEQLFENWSKANPELRKEWDRWMVKSPNLYQALQLPSFKVGDSIATRSASGKCLQIIAKQVPNLVGGSADLAPSNNTAMPEFGDFSVANPKGRTLHFGVREHAMGGIVNGMSLYGGLRPFCATFLVFSDYMKPAIRLAALMKQPVIYIFTHDSIFVGEDGPTHEPIEQLAALRSIPNLRVLRPGDAEETAWAWKEALLRMEGPTALILSRQNLEVYPKADPKWQETAKRGAYIVKDSPGKPEVIIIATGSEVSLALKASEQTGMQNIRIVSMVCREQFLNQEPEFRNTILPSGVRTIVAELGSSLGWDGFVQDRDDLFCLDCFGLSAPGQKVAEALNRGVQHLVQLIKR
ncbi:MAG: transketolase [Spirochaetes bacterium]|nr:transketolase [Spirochaetota bacterium]